MRHLLLYAALPGLLGACAAMQAPADLGSSTAAHERIHLLRSIRVERTPQSAWCTRERAGFGPFESGFHIDDRFSMWSVVVRSADGLVTDAKAGAAGELRTCAGPTADRGLFNFYVEGLLAGAAVQGRGVCRVAQADWPEKGIAILNCALPLTVTSPPWSAGFLSTSTVISRAPLGETTDPPGYVQASLATIRLWEAARP